MNREAALTPNRQREAGAVEIDYARWGQPQRFTASEFLALTAISNGLYVVDYGPVELPLLVRARGRSATFIAFHAAMQGERKPLPFLQGGSLAPDANIVLVGDPSLYYGLKLGWFGGSRHCALQAELPPILDHLERLLGSSRRVLFGSSGGGFAALYYARVEDAVVCVNPQTIVANFSPGPVQAYCRTAWGCDAAEGLGRFVSDLPAHYGGKALPEITYLQNSTDHHVQLHLEPFRASVGDRFRLVLGDWGVGHAAAPAEVSRAYISEAIQRA